LRILNLTISLTQQPARTTDFPISPSHPQWIDYFSALLFFQLTQAAFAPALSRSWLLNLRRRFRQHSSPYKRALSCLDPADN
jgi:hypothetical protein